MPYYNFVRILNSMSKLIAFWNVEVFGNANRESAAIHVAQKTNHVNRKHVTQTEHMKYAAANDINYTNRPTVLTMIVKENCEQILFGLNARMRVLLFASSDWSGDVPSCGNEPYYHSLSVCSSCGCRTDILTCHSIYIFGALRSYDVMVAIQTKAGRRESATRLPRTFCSVPIARRALWLKLCDHTARPPPIPRPAARPDNERRIHTRTHSVRLRCLHCHTYLWGTERRTYVRASELKFECVRTCVRACSSVRGWLVRLARGTDICVNNTALNCRPGCHVSSVARNGANTIHERKSEYYLEYDSFAFVASFL